MAADNEETFTMDITAESGEKYMGTVKVLKRLSHSKRLQRDTMRRELLGPNPLGATDDVLRSSMVLATCAVHILKGPKWYEDSNRGLDLLDEEPLVFIFNKINELAEKDRKALEEQATQAKKDLQQES